MARALAAGLSALAMMIASGLIFGWDLWLRWFPLILENLGSPNQKWIEYGRFCSVPEFRPYASAIAGRNPSWNIWPAAHWQRPNAPVPPCFLTDHFDGSRVASCIR